MTFTSDSQGGEYNHKLTVSEIPSHSHSQLVTAYNASGASGRVDYKEDNRVATFPQGISTESTGGNGKHNNIQPYKGAYFWRRVS